MSTGPSGSRASASWRPSCAATARTWPRTSRAATCTAPPSKSWPGEPVVPRSTSHGRRCTRLARGHDAVTRDPGFWLLDDGRAAFERAIGFRPTWRQRSIALGRRAGLLGYLGLALVGLVLTLGATLILIDWLAGGLSATVLIVVAVLGVLPFSDLSLGIVNQRLTHTFHVSVLPGLALRTGVPAEHRTLVVIPTLLDSLAGVDELVELLEVHYLANASGEIYFALVTDWLDSPTEHADGDDELVVRARLEIERLNELHGDYFLLLHRARRFNPAEGVWMGWERKRGKLEELNRLLRGDETTSFTTVEGRLPHDVKYVLTLDSDTRLPARRCPPPHRQARPPIEPTRVGARCRSPLRGFGILQPRVTPSLPMNEASSYFQRAFSTPPGLDPYAFAVSDVYQDLFGEGSFTGKGIYDVDAVIAATAGRIPENRVLSHDLLEGNYARSGLVTDVEVVEQFPMSYEVAAARAHRWARGDWQLLPWIIRRRPGISRLGRWKMLDNLRRSALADLPGCGAHRGLGAVAAEGGAGVVGCARRHLLRAAAHSCLQSAPSLADRDHGAQPDPWLPRRPRPRCSCAACWTSRSSVTTPG